MSPFSDSSPSLVLYAFPSLIPTFVLLLRSMRRKALCQMSHQS